MLDCLDRTLLRLLQEDARRSFRTLAKEAGTTPPTAAARIRRMEEAGIILGYTVCLDPDRFGTVDVEPVDVDASVNVACHTCHRPTSDPVWANVDGVRHPFCCTTCRRTYTERHAAFKQGL